MSHVVCMILAVTISLKLKWILFYTGAPFSTCILASLTLYLYSASFSFFNFFPWQRRKLHDYSTVILLASYFARFCFCFCFLFSNLLFEYLSSNNLYSLISKVISRQILNSSRHLAYNDISKNIINFWFVQ
jgi:hypothetical protein